MVKDTNTRQAVKITKEQDAQLDELSKEYKVSKSYLIGFALSAFLSYKAGDALGKWLIAKFEDEREDK